MIINIVNKLISLDLVNENEFSSLAKYKSDGTPDYYIKSRVGVISLKGGEIYQRTKYYDMVKYNGLDVQIQKNIVDGNYLGAITYNKNVIDIVMFGNDYDLEYLLTQYAFVYILADVKNTIFMHGSSIYYKEKGILFTAKSGTGKSTHRALWERYGNAVCINDDKNAIVSENDELYLYPNPWSGKHHIDNNIKAPLKAIVFLYQNKDNVVETISKKEALKLILGQIQLPSIRNTEDWDEMTNRLLDLPLYSLGCNMERDAFEILEKRMENDGIWQ